MNIEVCEMCDFEGSDRHSMELHVNQIHKRIDEFANNEVSKMTLILQSNQILTKPKIKLTARMFLSNAVSVI